MSFNLAGLKTYTLSASISSTQTSITLSSFKVPVSGDDVTMALLNTSIVYGTIDPKTSSSEFISFTGITQNADSTATLTGVTRGLNKTDPFTEDSDFKLPHSGAAEFICSNPPQVYNQFASPLNANTWTATQTFTGAVLVPTATSSDLGNAASIEFVVDTYTAGGVDASTTVKGLSKLSSAPASPTNPIAVGDTDTRVPTQGENDALAGTSGIPSSTNKYKTQSDTSGLFGSGADGAVTETTRSLTKDMYYSSLTVPNGVTLTTAGYRIFCTGTITLSGTGKIDNSGGNGGNGGNGSGATGGTAGTAGVATGAGSLPAAIAGTAGGAGGTSSGNGGGGGGGGGSGANGGIVAIYANSIVVGASASITSLGGNGGNGGNAANGQGGTGGGTGSVGSAGTAGLASSPSLGVSGTAHSGSSGNGGAGGGSNGGGGDNAGGAGGTSGAAGTATISKSLPYVYPIAVSLTDLTTGTANKSSAGAAAGGGGGSGGAGNLGNNGGGGGGGGGYGGSGGVIVLVYNTLTNSGTISVAGGSLGTKGTKGTGGAGNSADGNDGLAGATGVIYQLTV